MNEPILDRWESSTNRIHAVGGLHYMSGNRLPYFSLTMNSWVKKLRGKYPYGEWIEDGFGAAHEELIKLFPRLAPLARLHLSYMDGVPMHAVETGWYHLCGASHVLSPMVEYHAGNSGNARTPAQCIDGLSQHYRITDSDARELIRRVEDYMHAHQAIGAYPSPDVAKECLSQWVDEQKPRWKAEATECIQSLGLIVYGDLYIPAH